VAPGSRSKAQSRANYHSHRNRLENTPKSIARSDGSLTIAAWRALDLRGGEHAVEVALDPLIVNRDDITQSTRCIVGHGGFLLLTWLRLATSSSARFGGRQPYPIVRNIPYVIPLKPTRRSNSVTSVGKHRLSLHAHVSDFAATLHSPTTAGHNFSRTGSLPSARIFIAEIIRSARSRINSVKSNDNFCLSASPERFV
jgi:hypothetical protein